MSIFTKHRPDEFAEARTAAKPATAKAARPALPLGAPARATAVLTDLRAAEQSPAEQVATLKAAAERKIWAILNMRPLATDWSARIENEWTVTNARLDNAVERIKRTCEALLVDAVLSSLSIADFAAELDDDRAALFAGIAGERTVIYQWEQYAKSFVGLVPGATAKAEVA